MVLAAGKKIKRSTAAAKHRRGAAIVEMAIIGPIFFFILIGLIVAGLGVFRYQQVTALACESARWASVHGPNYSRVTGLPKADSEALLANVIRPRASGLDLSKLTCELEWSEGGSTATVILRYQWTPEALWSPVVFTGEAKTFVTY
jgi:hypothetical protein